MKRISAVIFDCDGVLFDSRQANINYYNTVLAHFDLPPMIEEDADFVHMHTAEESIQHIFRGTSLTDQAQAYRMKMKYAPFIKDMIIEPGLKELLTKLKPQYGLAIATNRSDTIGEVLVTNGLTDFFDIVVSSLDVKSPKPHPESIHKILSFFKIISREALYIGDSIVDWQTAQAAGVTFISYQNKFLETKWQAKRMIDLLEIMDIIERQPAENE